MIVKTYTAESAAAALKQIRLELGGDAVILKTTKGTAPNGRSAVHVTACAESVNEQAFGGRLSPDQISAVQAQPVRFFGQKEEKSVMPPKQLNRISESVTPAAPVSSPAASAQRGFQILTQIDQKLDQLLARPSMTPDVHPIATATDTPSHVSESILPIQHTTDLSLRTLLQRGYSLVTAERLQLKIGEKLTAGQSILSVEEELLSSLTQPITLAKGGVFVVVGPNGAGKSSLIGTLARKVTFGARLPVRLCSLDTTRIAASDELAMYSELLGAGILATTKIGSFAEGVTLVDTPGLGSTESFAALTALTTQHPSVTLIAAIPATISPAFLDSFSKSLVKLKPHGFIYTMTDLADASTLAVQQSLDYSWPCLGRINAGNGASDLLPLLDDGSRGLR